MSWRLYLDIGRENVKIGIYEGDEWREIETISMSDLVIEDEDDLEDEFEDGEDPFGDELEDAPDCELEYQSESETGDVSEDQFAEQLFDELEGGRAATLAGRIEEVIAGAGVSMTDLESVAVSCNSPVSAELPRYLAEQWQVPFRVAGKDLRHRLKSRFNLKQLAPDRLANIVAAIHDYEPPLVIIDLGLLIKIDVIAKGGLYLGGYTLASPQLITLGLAMLAPELMGALDTAPPSKPIGENALQAALLGLFAQTLAPMIDLIDKALDFPGMEEAGVLLTGGQAGVWLLPLAEFEPKVDALLTLNGLRVMDLGG